MILAKYQVTQKRKWHSTHTGYAVQCIVQLLRGMAPCVYEIYPDFLKALNFF